MRQQRGPIILDPFENSSTFIIAKQFGTLKRCAAIQRQLLTEYTAQGD